MATQGKIIEVLFENAIETYEDQEQLITLCDFQEPDGAMMQNAGNVVWRSVEQHAPILSGWDLTGQETDIIEETYPSILDVPKNDLVQQRADQVRDMGFWERRGKVSGRQQATEMNQTIANAMVTQGSMFYRSNASSGFSFISEAEAIMDERQGAKSMGRNFVFNTRTNMKFANELSGRQTLQGRPEQTWASGQIGKNVSQFDLHVGSYLPALAGGASPGTTVTGDQSFAPEGGSVNTSTGVVTNVDYRSATIPVAASGSYNVGDKVTFANGGTTVKSVGLANKVSTGQAMTFTIVAKPDATHITVYPKPIAYDDPGLTDLEKAYANIDTQILNGAVVARLNTVASETTNLFFAKDAVEVIGGTIPAQLYAQFAGRKAISKQLKNGLTMYMLYDGDITAATFKFRLFTWYNVTIKDPSRVGVAISYT